ncbi:hypothetical protein JFV29_12390 [Peribacillus sp. TH16]|uniref:hypothetical protein n=1 Tax=Peribacillus sp. TH16 TaxID=2798482 RepID=UPI001913C424|nr:hypothetical protein [Peribacillus sp. TH16]MBK5482681.1 hypothetical protein [Peribacillus sp. TH16]
MEEAQELRKDWGDKPSNHLRIVKEYYLGANTGDYVCTTCGRSASREYFEKQEQ